jgi:tRNA modification GTPase
VTELADTIYALCSGVGKAAIAVVRVSGPRSGAVVNLLCGGLPSPRKATVCEIKGLTDGRVLDRALVLWFEGPRSFTGEDCVEFHLHGSPGVVRLVVGELRRIEGLRPAEPGEFTRRAFINGKLDLVEVEGLADVLDAETEHQVRQALYHADGEASKVFDDWRSKIVRSLGVVEACIDFSDQDGVEAEARRQVGESVQGLCQAMARELANHNRGRRIRSGVRIVLVGAPNAGKSSLMNRLAAREVAIVSEEAGTTRDVIEVGLNLGGYSVDLLDTAGMRVGIESKAERLGVGRASDLFEEADIVLLIGAYDAVWPENRRLDSDTIRVWNKSDLNDLPVPDRADVAVSAKTGQGVDELLELLEARVVELCATEEPAAVVRERQVHAVEACIDYLRSAQVDGLELEIVAEELRLAAQSLERLIGKVDVEDLLDDIFSRFCIGK